MHYKWLRGAVQRRTKYKTPHKANRAEALQKGAKVQQNLDLELEQDGRKEARRVWTKQSKVTNLTENEETTNGLRCIANA